MEKILRVGVDLMTGDAAEQGIQGVEKNLIASVPY